MKYACIRAHREEYEFVLMCRVLQVSRSGYYAWARRGPTECEREDPRLRTYIRSIHHRSRQTYGSPRVYQELKADGVSCGKHRVARLMREEALVARPKRRARGTTNSRHTHEVATNELDRRFSVETHPVPDRVWVSDITYVPTREGWLYLAVVLDLASRRVVGWSMRSTLEAELATDALQMALWRRRPGVGLLHHSDRGVQYAAEAYQQILTQHGIRCSMSRKGNCWDNAVAESFFATLEWELIERSDWHTREEARRAIFDYIEVWYNRQRRHSSLGYRSPAEHEDWIALTARAAA